MLIVIIGISIFLFIIIKNILLDKNKINENILLDRIKFLEDEKKILLEKLLNLEKDNNSNYISFINFREKNILLEKLLIEQKAELEDLKQKLNFLQEENKILSNENSIFKEKNTNQAENIKTIVNIRDQLAIHFKTIATDVTNEQKNLFSKDLNNLLLPFSTEIENVRKELKNVENLTQENKITISANINNLLEKTVDIGNKADNLASTLKGNKKLQGNWGEMQLTSLFDSMGFKEGINYETQYNIKKEDNSNLFLDFILNLTENKKIIIDSKISLVNYSKYMETNNEEEKQRYLKQYCEDIKNHIKNLNSKEYHKIYKEFKKDNSETLDFVFMFLPLESAYIEAINYDASILDLAFQKQIVLVTISSIIPTIRIISKIWYFENQNNNLQEIFYKINNILEKFSKFTKIFEKIDICLTSARDAYNDAYSYIYTGNANISKTISEIQQLKIKGDADNNQS